MSRVLLPQGELILEPDFIDSQSAQQLYQTLVNELHWQQPNIRMFGKQVSIPRLQCFQGEPGIRYRYSGLTLQTEPWHPCINEIRQRIEAFSQQPFNSVLINYYRNGQDSMGWHSDDEAELGTNPVIASVSLGQVRRFLLRHRYDNTITRQEHLLNNGSLLIMASQLQHYWHHSVPKTNRPLEGRINLTFRHTLNPDMQME
ncbi:alpha-ketoglutarate-dependent dioxygenase AlkB [Amphritea sp. 1_MG-2023]|uniref:alpha-ketoglutarate-dependent dioxygenase AlkB family protein n=1 Tax=Amphritea sp. 1_MG-2023 TaxID=3062670 RepID=UPI0026E3D460|nr:alpha-ketoglutarate-dependent dioxygenase AlkB [Amphritea sp. 1_MG-2023]MDO6564104.1 alpha-ketoglutarate-dependent dioxygenase AlkB [Amphritea sp. 1_MG-2023]